MLNTRIVLCLLAFGVSSVMAQQPPVIVPEFHSSETGGNIDVFKNVPPDLKLIPKEAGSRRGQLWIRNIGSALLIAGQVDGQTPDFPQNKSQLLAKDHIEVWLATAPDVFMPPIGWGNQFEEQLLPKGPDSCLDWMKERNPDTADLQKCRSWAAQQQQYRTAFKKLFMRQWLLTSDYAVESYATPAYELIAAKYDAKGLFTAPLKPKGKIQMWSASASAHGYSFQIQIPYSAFPPANTPDLQNLWLMVDVFNAAPEGKKMGPYSSSSPVRAFGKPETFNQLQLQPRRSFRIAPCNVGLDGTDKYGNRHPGWFVPQHDQVKPGSEYESDSFIIVNEAEGYAYEPEGLSPVVRVTHHFWHAVGKDEWVCGPELVYQKGQSARRYDRQVAEKGFDAKRLQDGILLIKSGPLVYYSEFGSGQCGACPRYGLDMFALDNSLNLTDALSLGGVVQGDNDAADFTLSQDWSQVVHYQEQRPESENEDAKSTWSAGTYCLKSTKYEKCGEKQNVQPPDPPLLKELRDYSAQM